MEHPDITWARQTGYPRPIGRPAQKNTLCANYSTERDDKQMSLLEKIVKRVEAIEELNDKKAILYVDIHEGRSKVMFYDVDLFYELSDGHCVEVERKTGVFPYRAKFYVHGICFDIYLSEEEHSRLKELLANG